MHWPGPGKSLSELVRWVEHIDGVEITAVAPTPNIIYDHARFHRMHERDSDA